MKTSNVLGAVFFIFSLIQTIKSAAHEALESCEDEKGFKNLLKTKPNLLMLFSKSDSEVRDIYKLLKEVNIAVKGIASIAYINCE